MTEDFNQRLIAVIDAIPGDTDSPVNIAGLCGTAGFSQVEAMAVGPLLAAMLKSLGVLNVVSPTPGEVWIKAGAPTSTMFLRSLAEHLRGDRSLLDNWARPGTVDPPYSAQHVLSGPQFLYLVERRRLQADPTARALRNVEIAQIIVSRRARGRSVEYLLLHDAAAQQYQLPGGHRRSGDRDISTVALRELQEEVLGFTFDPARDRLVRIGAVRAVEVSRTLGVVTGYDITFFQLRSTRADVQAGPHGRWVDARILTTEGATVEGLTTNLLGLRMLDAEIPGGVRGMEPGFRVGNENWLVSTAITRPLEFWGFVLGVVGLVLSVVFYFIS
ncbi:hypothetical protein [Dactylosporangium sp. NPDC000521]|uniref:hypothetical protein n=1 Tax=Dactylosporangium sp. NPDC000521 TaxID=3363975 RepID=UPI003674972B